MNIISNFNPAICSKNQIIAQRRQATPNFTRLIDYYEPEEIYEAREHGGVFREHGEDDISYERRAREINEAWERNQNRRDDRSFWDKLLGSNI